MKSRALPCLLVAALTLGVVGAAFRTAPVDAGETMHWSDTISHENVLVHDCREPVSMWGGRPTHVVGIDFSIMTSYTADRTFNVVTDYTGAEVVERQHISFAGLATSAETDISLAFGGHFTRTTNSELGARFITGLVLRLAPPNADLVTVSVDRDISGLIDSPETALRFYAPRGLQTSLCGYFAGLKEAG